MKKKLLLLTLISVTALIAHAKTPDSDIIDSTGTVVGHIHYNDPSPPLPPSYFETHNLEYWMDYYSRATFQAEILAHQNAQALLARQAREAQEWAVMRREARDGWYSGSREKQLYWENVVPGVREAVKRGDYIKVFNLIGDSSQFKQMRSAQKKK